MSINYNPQFQHQDWVDNVDRVQAGGPNGFNGRFHSLEAEFQTISQVVGLIAAALNALGTKPPPAPVRITLTPTLVATAALGWLFNVNGTATKQAGQTSAHGMMSVQLPAGATVQTFRATGRNSDAAQQNPGPGNLRLVLSRQSVDPTATGTQQQVALVNGVGVTFDTTIAANNQFATVDNDHFRYFVSADLDNAAATDVVQLNSFQITVLGP